MFVAASSGGGGNATPDVLTSNNTGHKIASHTSIAGVSVDINETITSIAQPVLT
jgi:hypothetical protein